MGEGDAMRRGLGQAEPQPRSAPGCMAISFPSRYHPAISTSAAISTCCFWMKGGFLAKGPSPPWSGLAPSWRKNCCSMEVMQWGD